MEIKEIILSSVAPNYTRAIWAHPIDGDIVELRVFNNGEWQATTVKTDLSNYVTIPSLERELANYLTITAAADTYQPVGDYASTNDLQSHVNNTENPHSVTKEQVGLGNVDNTSDTDKPISTAVQNALNNKQDSTDNNLSTTDKTIVGAINEILPKATGVGKVDPNSDGTGEIFNSYEEWGGNTASGSSSHAEGAFNQATGDYSHAEGYSNIASGRGSHAEGNSTRAAGVFSHAEGNGTQTFSSCEHAEGRYNKSYDSMSDSIRTIHTVGFGDEFTRKNAHEIKFSGIHYVYGIGGFDGTNSDTAQSLQEVIYSKQNTLTAGTGIEITPENQINVTLDTNVFFVAETVPESPSDDQKKKICLVPADTTEEGNFYTEYVWVIDDTHPNGYWEEFGTYKSEVDLTPYLKTADAANTYLSKNDAASTYLSKTDASSTYLNKTDASSTYLSKTDAASTYQPVGDYATSTELTEGLAGKQDSGSYATTTQLETLQTEVNSKADSTALPTYTTVPTLTADYNIPANATTVEKVYDITVGATLYNITYDTAIKWVNGVAPITTANHRYLVSVINNLGAWGEF